MARKEKNIHYIYKTTCNVTGKWYIGMHSTLNENDDYMGSGKILRYSIRKYGAENHTKEILSYYDSRELLIEAEINIVNSDLIKDKNCLNIREGGTGGFSSKEHMDKCQLAGAKAYHEKFNSDESFRKARNKKSSEIIKKNHADGKMNPKRFKDKNHSDESKQLISLSMKNKGQGEENSQYDTCWITRDSINKKIKKETLESFIIDGWVQGRK